MDVQDNAGWTPLHEAALRDHGAIVQLLLRYALIDTGRHTHASLAEMGQTLICWGQMK